MRLQLTIGAATGIEQVIDAERCAKGME